MGKNPLKGSEKLDIMSNKYKGGANVKQSRLNSGPIGKTSRKPMRGHSKMMVK